MNVHVYLVFDMRTLSCNNGVKGDTLYFLGD